MAPCLEILVSLPVAEATPTSELAFPVLSGMQPVPIAREVGMANTNLNASNQTILAGIRSYHWSQASAIPWLVLVLNNHHVANLKVAARRSPLGSSLEVL